MSLTKLPGSDLYVLPENVVVVELRPLHSRPGAVYVTLADGSDRGFHRTRVIEPGGSIEDVVTVLHAAELVQLSADVWVARSVVACVEATKAYHTSDALVPVCRVTLAASAGGRVIDIPYPNVEGYDRQVEQTKVGAAAIAAAV